MTQARGSNTKIVVGIETLYNTISGSFGTNKKAIVIPFASFNVKNTENQIVNPMIKGNRNPIRPGRGNRNPSGTLSTLLTPHMYSLLAYTLGKRKVTDSFTNDIVVTNHIYMKGAAGQTIVNNVEGYTTTGENAAAIANETAPYIHTFSIGEIPSFTIESQFAGLGTAQYRRFKGCCVNMMKIKIPNEGYIGLDFDIIAAEETIASSAMAVGNELEYEHMPYDAFELAEAHVMLGDTYTIAEAVAYIDSIDNIVINNNLGSEGYVLGGGGIRKSLPPGIVSVTGSCKIMFTDSGTGSVALLTSINAGVKKSIILTLIRGNTTLALPGSAPPQVGNADNEAIQIILPELTFAATSPSIEGPTGVYFEGTFTGFYEESTVDSLTSGIQIKLINSDAPRL